MKNTCHPCQVATTPDANCDTVVFYFSLTEESEQHVSPLVALRKRAGFSPVENVLAILNATESAASTGSLGCAAGLQ